MIYMNQVSPPVSPAPGTPAPFFPTPGAPGTPTPFVPTPGAPGTPSSEEILASEQLAVVGTLRLLWLQLAIWERSFIVSAVGNLGDIQAITDRLLQIPEAFAGFLGQYFTPQEADQFKELLEEHINTVTALVSAEKNNDIQMVNQETSNLYENANRIAAYLAVINSYWNEEQWKDVLDDYIEILLADLVARESSEYAKEITIFDDLQTQAVKIADLMSGGMLQKFRP